jgi:hypothetical protein
LQSDLVLAEGFREVVISILPLTDWKYILISPRGVEIYSVLRLLISFPLSLSQNSRFTFLELIF